MVRTLRSMITRCFLRRLQTQNTFKSLNIQNSIVLRKRVSRQVTTERNSSKSNLGFTKPNSHKKHNAKYFEHICYEELKKLESSFQKMKTYEPKIEVINFQPTVLDLEIEIAGVGIYRFYANSKDSLMLLFSPLGGSFTYFYEESEHSFYNTRDGHNMEEYLMRELLGKVNGYLDL